MRWDVISVNNDPGEGLFLDSPKPLSNQILTCKLSKNIFGAFLAFTFLLPNLFAFQFLYLQCFDTHQVKMSLGLKELRYLRACIWWEQPSLDVQSSNDPMLWATKRPCRYMYLLYLPNLNKGAYHTKGWHDMSIKMLWCNIFEITWHQIPCLLMSCRPGLRPIPELELELPSIPIPELLGIRIARSGIGIWRCIWNRIEDAISILRFFNHTFEVHSTYSKDII